MFNQPIFEDVFPPNLTILNFASYYTSPISPGVLPSKLKSLKMRIDIGGSLTGILPSTLTELQLFHFNSPINPGDLPESLISFTLSPNYDHRLFVNSLPQGLKYLKFGDQYRQSVSGVLPPNLTTLIFGNGYNGFINK